MFKKYDKTFRIKIPEYDVKGKLTLSSEDLKLLLSGKVTVEEKMDGANVGIIRHKTGFHLQKRGSLVGTSEHEQYRYFNNWARYQNYDKIMSFPNGYIVYGELLYVVHTLFYDSLPDFFLCFDVWNGARFLTYEERDAFCKEYGLHQVPLIYQGYLTLNELYALIPGPSAYGEMAEGIVIKKYKKKGLYLRGKIVKPEFMKSIDEDTHWMNKPIKRNRLKKG